MTKNIKDNSQSFEKIYYLKHSSSKEENAENELIHKRKIKRKNSGGIILLIILLLGIVWLCWSNYTPVTYLQVEESLLIPNEGTSVELELSTDAISSSIFASSSEDWIDCRVSGKTLYISANTNSKKERSASVTITAYSSFFGSELSDRKQETITVSQETGYASHLSASNDDIYLTANGGNTSISINTDGIFAVSTAPASWVSTSINGKTLNLAYSENSGTMRDSYLIISSGSKSKRINITQAGKSATRLDLSTYSVEFNANGGSRTIEIYTDGECKISTQPESWANATISGNSISLRVNENSGTKRSDYFEIKSGSYEKRINISQAGKTATHLNVSSDNISYSYSGGTRTITVSTDGEWQISTGTAGWGHTSISGNTITLKVDENTSSSSRTDYFVIKSGSKEKRINISQDGKPATRLSVSTENISFGKDGGSRTITVSTNGKWEIGVGTASWGHTNISGNTITLRVDKNNTGDERTDYFTVVAGDKKVRINITQAGGPSAEVNRVWVEHNIPRTGYNTVGNVYMGWQQLPYTYYVMRIHIDFDIENMKGKTIYVCAFFYDEDGNKMRTSNNDYRTSDGQVTVQDTATPRYDSSNYSDFKMEIPVPVMRKGSNKFRIQIQDSNGNVLANSDYEYFSVN